MALNSLITGDRPQQTVRTNVAEHLCSETSIVRMGQLKADNLNLIQLDHEKVPCTILMNYGLLIIQSGGIPLRLLDILAPQLASFHQYLTLGVPLQTRSAHMKSKEHCLLPAQANEWIVKDYSESITPITRIKCE